MIIYILAMRCIVFSIFLLNQVMAQSEVTSSGSTIKGNGLELDITISSYPTDIYTNNDYIVKLGVLQPEFKKDINPDTNSLKIYNFVTANGDGKNDFLEIAGLSKFKEHQLRIFNKLGNIIFESTDYQNDWQGGADFKDETYFFELKIDQFNRKGVIFFTKDR